MFNAILVEDEIMVRTAVERMIDWQAEGFRMAGCYPNGEAALAAFGEEPVDLVITDIKMPVMGGLALLEWMRERGYTPQVVVLSAFDDFPLVKQAFQLGAFDYLLKNELTAANLRRVVTTARARLEQENPPARPQAKPPREHQLSEDFRRVVLGRQPPSALIFSEGPYTAACFLLDDRYNMSRRFSAENGGNLEDALVRLVYQLPQFPGQAWFTWYDSTRYFLLCPTSPGVEAPPLVETVQRALRNYMNISATVGLCGPFQPGEGQALARALETAELSTALRYVYSSGEVYGEARRRPYDTTALLAAGQPYRPLGKAVLEMDEPGIDLAREALLHLLDSPLEEARFQALACLFTLYFTMGNRDLHLTSKAGLSYGLREVLWAQNSQREVYLYCLTALRRAAEHVESELEHRAPDAMTRAKRIIDDRYSDGGLSMAEVAAQIGYSEKYFSTRFRKTFGLTFSQYLTQTRIAAAGLLLRQSNLKVYQVAEAVGYKSTEHFIRMFRQEQAQSPAEYRRKKRTKHQ